MAEPCQKRASIRWIPLLILEGPGLEPGITTSVYERLPGSFCKAGEAMDAAEKVADQRLGAVDYSAKRVEECYAD